MGDTYKKSKGNAGLDGVQFQLNLLTVILLNAFRSLKNWKISSENPEAGKYDDIVLELPDKSAVLFQAKYKENRKVTKDQFLSSNSKKADFSLPKYFFSYYEINAKFKEKAVYICTNTSVNTKDLENILIQHDIGCDSMLHYEGSRSSYLTFNENILPDLKASAEIYCGNNLQGNGQDIITDDNLRVFLKHLRVIVNYPSGEDLNKIIEQLLSRLNVYNLAANVSSQEIYRKIEDWFKLKQKRSEYLTEARTEAMLCEIRSDRYSKALRDYNVLFERNEFRFTEQAKIFHVNSEGDYLLQILKIHDALRSDKSYKLYVTPDEDVETVKLFFEAFKLSRYKFMIIIWPKFKSESILEELSDTLTVILERYKYKKVIFVAESNNKFVEEIGKANSVVNLNACIRFEDFSSGTREKLMEIKNIVFQGRHINLEELLGAQTFEYFAKVENSEILQKLLTGEEVKVGVQPLNLDEDIARYYISRTFRRSIDNLKDEGETSSDGTETISEENVFDIEQKLVLVADSAGMGKSVVLTKLGTIVKEKHPHLWVIRIALCDYTNILRDFKVRNSQAINARQLLDSVKETELASDLEKFVFSMDKKVVLLLDGVDEVSPDYTKLILNLITECVEAPNVMKVFVTTRPHITRELKAKLSVQPLVMLPFTNPNQVDFLTSYWIHSLNLTDEEDRDKCMRYSEVLIKRMSAWTDSYRYDFTAIPLQVRMLAEIFTENTRYTTAADWEGCVEYLKGTEREPKLPQKMNMAELYLMFIKKKRDIMMHKMNPTGNSWVNKLLVQDFHKCLAQHRIWALKEVLGNRRSSLFLNCQQKDIGIETDALKLGIVQKVDNNFQFLHRTFAEYFVAECLLKELQLRNESATFQNFFIEEVLREPWFKVIRTFLDSFIGDAIASLSRNFFVNYQSKTYIYDVDELLDYNPILVLAEDGCVSILRYILKCIDFKVVIGKEAVIRKKDNIWVRLAQKFGEETGNVGNVLNSLQKLTRQGGINIKNKYGETPLHCAANSGHLEMVKFLVQQGANMNAQFPDRDGSTGAAHIQEKIKAFGGYTPIHCAAWCGHLDIVKYLVDMGVDFSIGNSKNRTALHLAACKGHLNIVKYLLGITSDVNMKDSYGCTMMYFAAANGQLDVIKYLVEMGAEVDFATIHGNTVLEMAARRNHMDIVKYLAEIGASVNTMNVNGNTALHLAAIGNKLNIIKYLAEAGANFSIRNKDGHTAMQLAAMQGHLDAIKQFVGFIVDASLTSNVMTCRALIFKYLDKFGADMSIKDSIDWEKLDEAITEGQFEDIKRLIEVGVYVGTRDKNGCTVLHFAAARGDLDTVKFFVTMGVGVDIKDRHGRTACDIAKQNGRSGTVKYFAEMRENGDNSEC